MQAATSHCREQGRLTQFLLVAMTASIPLAMGLARSNAQVQKTERENDRSQRAAQMEQLAKGIQVYQVTDEKRVAVPRHEQPLLRFSDPAREFFDGTLWAWGTSGRPLAIVTLERYRTMWSYELVSLATEGVVADLPDGRQWAPRKPGLEWQAIPDAPAPADDEAKRLRQAKTLAERFTAVETVGEGNYVLRRMPTPIHRYSSRDAGILGGALFILVYGTNPEVLVVLECRDGAKPGWHYSLSRLTSAAVSVRLDGREVWTRPLVNADKPDEPYFAFGREVKP